MNFLALALLLLTLLEYWAFNVFRSSPFGLPSYFTGLLTAIQFAMCFGGLESARWLLRRSPAARTAGPYNDRVRLWLWLGPPGGLLMVLSSCLAWWVDRQSGSGLGAQLILAHAAGGGAAWLLMSLDVVPRLALLESDEGKGASIRLAALGLFSHLTGLWFYAWLFPVTLPAKRLVILGAMMLYFLCYYIWAACLVWWAAFRVWQPPAGPTAASVELPALG